MGKNDFCHSSFTVHLPSTQIIPNDNRQYNTQIIPPYSPYFSTRNHTFKKNLFFHFKYTSTLFLHTILMKSNKIISAYKDNFRKNIFKSCLLSQYNGIIFIPNMLIYGKSVLFFIRKVNIIKDFNDSELLVIV